MIAFVSGGARSGKSRIAEDLARRWRRPGQQRHYLATGEARDAEMQARIERHRRERDADWQTLEAPLALDAALALPAPGSLVLLDCLTLWASRWLFDAGRYEDEGQAVLRRAWRVTRRRDLTLIVVSNDLNEEVPSRHALVRRYLAFLQSLHCQLAEDADLVIEALAGQAIVWQGEMP